jgi:hypothetical protein
VAALAWAPGRVTGKAKAPAAHCSALAVHWSVG